MLANSFYSQLDDREKYIVNCCFFIFFINGIYGMIFGSLLPSISETYQLNDTISGLLLSAHQAGNLLAGFIAGLLPVYIGRKNSILFLSSFVLIGFLLIPSTGSPWLLLLAFLFTGISRGSISNFNNKVVNDVSGSSASALNFLHSVFAVGALLSPFLVILCTFLSPDNGWRIACFIIVVLIFLSQFMFLRMPITNEKTTQDHQPKNGKQLTFLKDSRFWNTVFILFFYLCAEAAVNGWLVKYFVDSNILTVDQAQVLSSILWFGILIGRLGCTFWGHMIERRHLLLAISIGTAFFYSVLLLSTQYWLIALIILGLGISMGGIYPTAMTIAGDSIKIYPMAMGILLIIGGIGGILMPTITGILSTNFGIFAGMLAVIVALIIMLLSVCYYAYQNRSQK